MEIANIDKKTKEKIKMYCLKNAVSGRPLSLGAWAQKAHEALTKQG